MSNKKDYVKNRSYAALTRENVFRQYMNKYYNHYISKYKINGLDYRQSNFLFRKWWDIGKISLWNLKHLDEIGLADFAVEEWDYLDSPLSVRLIANRGADFVPKGPMTVDKDCVIGWARKDQHPVREYVEMQVSRITDVEMIIRTNLKASKQPWIIAAARDDERKVNEFINMLESDEPNLFFNFDDPSSAPRALVSGANYIIDKLYAYKQALENELLTYLGINNMGAAEKKEHLITSEVESNDELISDNKDCFVEPLKEFLERANEVLGCNLSLVEDEPEVEEDEAEDDGGEDVSN